MSDTCKVCGVTIPEGQNRLCSVCGMALARTMAAAWDAVQQKRAEDTQNVEWSGLKDQKAVDEEDARIAELEERQTEDALEDQLGRANRRAQKFRLTNLDLQARIAELESSLSAARGEALFNYERMLYFENQNEKFTTQPCVDCEEKDARIAELEAVVEKAREWWQSKKPTVYSNADHRSNPAVNLATETEKALAHEVAAIDALEKPEP